MEHRWGQRIAVDMPIQIVAAASPWKAGHLINLSITGALVKVDFKPRLLSLVVIVIDLWTPTLPDTRRFVGYVARVDQHGIGVEWCAIATSAVIDLVRTSADRMSRGIEAAELVAWRHIAVSGRSWSERLQQSDCRPSAPLGLRYRRCFNPSFISSVHREGL